MTYACCVVRSVLLVLVLLARGAKAVDVPAAAGKDKAKVKVRRFVVSSPRGCARKGRIVNGLMIRPVTRQLPGRRPRKGKAAAAEKVRIVLRARRRIRRSLVGGSRQRNARIQLRPVVGRIAGPLRRSSRLGHHRGRVLRVRRPFLVKVGSRCAFHGVIPRLVSRATSVGTNMWGVHVLRPLRRGVGLGAGRSRPVVRPPSRMPILDGLAVLVRPVRAKLSRTFRTGQATPSSLWLPLQFGVAALMVLLQSLVPGRFANVFTLLTRAVLWRLFLRSPTTK